MAVGRLAAGLPVTRSAVSQHLKILKDAGLVSERADGTRRIYRLNPTAVAALRDQLDTFWSRALANYEDIVETGTQGQAEEKS
jgi:DNA-binding transcriptional ArsR family regulator